MFGQVEATASMNINLIKLDETSTSDGFPHGLKHAKMIFSRAACLKSTKSQ